MWSLLWHAWHWSEALTWSADAWCGQFVNGCQVVLGSSIALAMLAALLLADTWGSWLWSPSPVPLWCFFQGSTGRGFLLAPWTPCNFGSLFCALDVLLVRPFAEAYPRNVLPLWLCFCGSFHPFFAWCSIHDLPCTRACHGVLHRSPWPCHCVICKALASHRGLARNWWVMFGLCATIDQWHAVWVSLASWLRFCVTLGSWCKVVHREPDMFYVPWWLLHPGVQCQGLLRWLAHAARTYGFGSFGPCPGWGYSAHLWFSFPVTWCANFHSRVDLWVLRCLSHKSPCRFLLHDLPCTHACHGVLHRPPWLCHCVACKALASHRGLSRDWWVMLGLCATLDQWHAVWVSLASWLRCCVTLGSWCKVVRREPDMFYVPWWLSCPRVRCQGLLRWLAHAARAYGLGSFGPCPGWGYSAQLCP
ncbi:hypothetical protein V6N12_033051 [Hibiscus sabdariffa]|uniref:Uncharacterized protein n=1 Tax=Hibiscus sabdariffa TaxID=183260 RepID=A0ABR2CEV2_9ROSI